MASEPCVVSPMEEGKSCFEKEVDEANTIIGAETGCRPGEVTVFFGGRKSCTSDTGAWYRNTNNPIVIAP